MLQMESEIPVAGDAGRVHAMIGVSQEGHPLAFVGDIITAHVRESTRPPASRKVKSSVPVVGQPSRSRPV